jgi:hypothetical protein
MKKSQAAQLVLLGLGMMAAGCAMAECDPEESARWNQRYELRGSEVYDQTTDLTWARCPVGMNWQEDSGCLGKPVQVKYTKAMDIPVHPWRVPEQEELKTLISPHCKDPIVDQNVFPSTPSIWFYAATRSQDAYCWRVHFGDGTARTFGHAYLNCDVTHAVRLVRSGK